MRSAILSFCLLQAFSVSAQNKLITLEDIWKDRTFAVKSVPGFAGTKDGMQYSDQRVDSNLTTIQLKSLKDGKEGNILYQGKLTVDEYLMTDKQDRLLLLTEGENIYRRSILHKVYVYDPATKQETLLDNEKLLHATLSPDGSKVAYVKGNNLYFKDLKTGETTAVTTDGKLNSIINGNCDWVYEEEFSFTQAYQWSPDGKYLAFYRFDESGVPTYTMTMYDGLYPKPYQYKYPKAGEPNSVVEIGIYDLATKTTVKPQLFGADGSMDYYVPRIVWTKDPGQLCIFRMNRRQNHLDLLLTEALTGMTSPIYQEDNKDYINISDNIEFLPDGKSFLFSSELDGWNHLYVYDWKAKKLRKLTEGNYDVDALIGTDAKAQKVYYTAADPGPLQRRLYSIGINGKNRTTLTPEPGVHAITPIEGNQYFLDRLSRLNDVPVFTLRDANGKIVRTLEDNAALKSKMQEYRLGKAELIEVKGAGGKSLNAWRMLPPNFDSTKKYPVLMYQYSGPASQEVADRFPIRDYFWHQMLAEKGYIIFCADGTGTGFRGEAFRKETYLQLGKKESEDQIAVAKYLATLSYVDAKRIGIWGWSYGGFMSATCMMKGADIFKTGISVAPVTNWRYYDNIYTERYMRKPAENVQGYDDNAPENLIDGLKGNFLLVHGTGDDNVHVQNSLMMMNKMISAEKEFDSEFYPNRAHGISGDGARYHLYRRMTEFILEKL
jgi:dipeptidyl-peptidase-4